jgi:3'-phosphoadenosine 5'-phosphosulfate sulfotransferase (PAPS reductase)/FAD synthetase
MLPVDKRGKRREQIELPFRHELEISGSEVARMTRSQRELRVRALMARSHSLVDAAESSHGAGKSIVARCVLFSGGNDSTTLMHLMRQLNVSTHAIHANTGIGIEKTRDFVRNLCKEWQVPLIEVHPASNRTYEELVLKEGFPGPAKHYKAYQWLKESALDAARKPLGTHRSRTNRALYIAGRRREESTRRSDIPLHESDGSVIWVAPIAEWTKLDLNTYRLMFDVPRNEVADLIHMSGECGCGSFAQKGELEEWGDWFPEFRAEVERLEALIANREDIPVERRKWGWGAYRGDLRPPRRVGRLCSSCQSPAA